MGLKERLKRFEAEQLAFTLPDGSKIGLRPVNGMTVVPRLGLPPQILKRFFEVAEAGEAKNAVEKKKAVQALTEDPEMVAAGIRWDEAYWVEGVVSIDGEPVRLVFSHETAKEGEIPVPVFKAFLAATYGQEVVEKVGQTIQRISGYILPEEVKANAEAFQDAARHAAHPGEGVRDQPGGNPEDAAGGIGPVTLGSPGGGGPRGA